MGKKAGYFGICTELLATYDQKLSYWKTLQQSLFQEEEWIECYTRFQKSGIVLNGSVYGLQILDYPTEEKESSLSVMLPTPTASDSWNTKDSRKRFNNPNSKEYSEKKQKTLSCQNLHTALTIMLPTPTAANNLDCPTMLHHWKGLLPTPTASDPIKHTTGGLHRLFVKGIRYSKGDHRNNPPNIADPKPDPKKRRRLNPQFIEWMMGFPQGYTTTD